MLAILFGDIEMTKTEITRRREIVYELMQLYSRERLTMCYDDFFELVKPKAMELCQKAFDEGVKLSKSKGNQVFCAAVTVAGDARLGGVCVWSNY